MSAASVAERFSSWTQSHLSRAFAGFFMVPGGGLEPPRPCGLRILSPLRLPVSLSGFHPLTRRHRRRARRTNLPASDPRERQHRDVVRLSIS